MEMAQIKNLLILIGQNDRAAIALLRALKDKNIDIFLAFINKPFLNFNFKTYLKNRLFYYNAKTENDFIQSLIEIARFLKPYTIMPLGENVLRWSLKHRPELFEYGVNIPTVDLEIYEKLSDKLSFVNLCKQAGFNIPRNIDIPDIDLKDKSSFSLKFVVKPKILKPQTHVPLLIENKKSYQHFLKLQLNMNEYFIQEYVTGPSIYYCGQYIKGTKVLSFAQINLHQQPDGHSVIKAVPYELPGDFVSRIDTMMQSVNWDGIMMIEFKRDEISGQYYAIECNPRFWGPLQLCIDNGINFPATLLGLSNINKLTQKRYGYIWLIGYLIGFITKLKTGSNFQFYKDPTRQKIYYRDIWFRVDTVLYFFEELTETCCLLILNLLKLKQTK
jgi:predicted ATP-grasp superfamily ATP-dependent carboligase